MQIGVWLPSTEFDVDPERLVRFAEDMERSGLSFLEASDHVLTTRLPPEHRSASMIATGFHDPFLLFAFLAPRTTLSFATSVLVLPQRPAALVAKQLAELVWLFGDRFRLGVGSGWNAREFEALGVDFAERGAILTEQVAVIEALWPGDFTTLTGHHHRLDDVGIAPAPPRARAPLWFGGHGRRVLDRVAQWGEGWMPLVGPDEPSLAEEIESLRRLTVEAGRDPADLGLEGRIAMLSTDTVDDWLRAADGWQALGVTHLSLTYQGGGFVDLDRATEAIQTLVPRLTA